MTNFRGEPPPTPLDQLAPRPSTRGWHPTPLSRSRCLIVCTCRACCRLFASVCVLALACVPFSQGFVLAHSQVCAHPQVSVFSRPCRSASRRHCGVEVSRHCGVAVCRHDINTAAWGPVSCLTRWLPMCAGCRICIRMRHRHAERPPSRVPCEQCRCPGSYFLCSCEGPHSSTHVPLIAPHMCHTHVPVLLTRTHEWVPSRTHE